MPHKQIQKQLPKNKVNKINQALRYSGLAFEMFAVIFAGVFGGIKLDEKLQTSPLFTVILSVLGVFAALYFALKDLLKKK